jgi:hypothetical protein
MVRAVTRVLRAGRAGSALLSRASGDLTLRALTRGRRVVQDVAADAAGLAGAAGEHVGRCDQGLPAAMTGIPAIQPGEILTPIRLAGGG